MKNNSLFYYINITYSEMEPSLYLLIISYVSEEATSYYVLIDNNKIDINLIKSNDLSYIAHYMIHNSLSSDALLSSKKEIEKFLNEPECKNKIMAALSSEEFVESELRLYIRNKIFQKLYLKESSKVLDEILLLKQLKTIQPDGTTEQKKLPLPLKKMVLVSPVSEIKAMDLKPGDEVLCTEYDGKKDKTLKTWQKIKEIYPSEKYFEIDLESVGIGFENNIDLLPKNSGVYEKKNNDETLVTGKNTKNFIWFILLFIIILLVLFLPKYFGKILAYFK